jgi:tRNA A37 methylthiotransferase MiaB
MAGKFFLRTFGCQMNRVDSEDRRVLRGPEPRASRQPDEAVIVFNTCSVRKSAGKFADLAA